MADTSGKKPSASRNGSTQKNTQKRTTQRSNTRNYSTDNRRSNSKKRNVSKQDSALYSEIGLIVLLVFMLFLFFCNLGLIGPFGNTIRGVLFGLFGLAASLNGFLYKKMNPIIRLVIILGGLTLMYPGLTSDVIGLVLIIGVIVFQKIAAKKETAIAA